MLSFAFLDQEISRKFRKKLFEHPLRSLSKDPNKKDIMNETMNLK
jgi:hypothetical protein